MPDRQAGFAPIVVLILFVLSVAGTYTLVQSFKPHASKETPQILTTKKVATSATPSASLIPSAKPSPSIVASFRPVVVPTPSPSCIKVKTYAAFSNDSELESNKCYSASDAEALEDAMRHYNNATFNYDGAANKANVTCQGFTDSFKQMCEESKKDVDKYKAEVDKYKAEVKAIIARGE